MDDTLAMLRDIPAAMKFLSTSNNYHPVLSFTIELAYDKKLPFSNKDLQIWNPPKNNVL